MEDETIEVMEEVEALEATLVEGVIVRRNEKSGRPTELDLSLTPLTASDEERKYVSLTLRVEIPLAYPRESPKVVICNPRGLDESDLKGLERDLKENCRENLGDPVLYGIAEHTREFLTERNFPACPCVLCLCDIKEEDAFVKTLCYHYFHSRCYGDYIRSESGEKNLRCPVCRDVLISDLSSFDYRVYLDSAPPVVQVSETLVLTEELAEARAARNALYEKQKANGAIIDIEAENKKYLVSIMEESTPSSSSYIPASSPPTASSASSMGVRPKPKKSTQSSSKVDKARQDDPRRQARYKKYQSHNASRHQMHKNMKHGRSGEEGTSTNL